MSTGVHVNARQRGEDVTGDVRVLQTNKDAIGGLRESPNRLARCNRTTASHVWKKTK